MANRFQELVDSINKLAKSGVLGTEDELFLKRALKDLRHAVSVKNSKKLENSVNRICRRLLERVV